MSKSVPLKSNNTTVGKSPKLPAVKARHEWRDFDDHTRVAEVLMRRLDEVNAGCAKKPFNLEAAKFDASWRAGTLAMEREFDEGREFFEREELYQKTKKSQPDLLDCWSNRVITRRVVAEQVGVLLGSFPNSNPHNAEVYTRVMIEEIVAAKPSASALEATMRHLRRNSTFAPSVAEMLKVLREKMELWSGYHEMYVAECYDALDEKIAQAEAKLAGRE
jgi:hypothetical protein